LPFLAAGQAFGGNHMQQKNGLTALVFDHRLTDQLSADVDTSNTRRQVFEACYSWVEPTPTAKPKLLIYASEVAELLGLSELDCASDLFKQIFSGNALLADMKPYAMCYGGHQFGNWAGQLGDGRAINLGDVINKQGQRWTLQLKGAGETPYSRSADGLAVLRSSIREFLCSEAMFHLGVPTTRALSLCLTGDVVLRDMFYDGHADYEKGAVVCRVAPSFLRFGNFQLFSARKDMKNLEKLLHYSIQADFPHLLSANQEPHTDTYLAWFAEVCRLNQEMVVHWMRVGFVHGVMNTDNMSILGLTIDYGPYGWLEVYDPDWTPNTTDAQYHRYAFGQQGCITHWNLAQLAQAIAPLLGDVQVLQATLDAYSADYKQAWQTMMGEKLGFQHQHSEEDQALVDELLRVMQLIEIDMTLFYRNLANIDVRQSVELQMAAIADAFYDWDAITAADRKSWHDWFHQYSCRLLQEHGNDAQRRLQMNAVNPKYVLRNYLSQMAIDQAEEGDVSLLHELLGVLRHPYDEQKDKSHFAKKRPEWARHRAGCSMLSCSS